MSRCATVLLSVLILVSAPLQAADVEEQPRLVAAIRAGDGDEVMRLLAAGADPRTPDATGQHAYDWMIASGHYAVALPLLLHAAQTAVAPGDAGVAALGLSVVRGDSVSVFHLLRAGVAMDAPGPSGYTALSLALRFARESEVVRLLAALTRMRATPTRCVPRRCTWRRARVVSRTRAVCSQRAPSWMRRMLPVRRR
jgi:hypothetical protein